MLGDNDEDLLYLVDVRSMRLLGEVRLQSPSAPHWLGWLGPLASRRRNLCAFPLPAMPGESYKDREPPR